MPAPIIQPIATILTPHILQVGGGAVAQVADVLKRLGVARPLVVTDPFMVKSGKVAAVLDPLAKAGMAAAVFSETVSDPTTTVIDAGVARLKAGGPGGAFDCMIGFGGGSPIDTAKAMAILHAGGGAMRDWKVPAAADMPALPIVAVPTTAGTGSEVTRFTIITDVASDEKMLILGLACLPVAAIVDYELTLSVPYRTTADTGIDSLTHAIEAYVSKRANPYSDAAALSAMARIARHIRTACAEPDNRVARAEMMFGATQAGMAFSNASVALVHGMSRPIGAFFHVAHGLSNAMLLPSITAFSAAAALGRYADCARAMGWAEAGEGDQAAVAKLLDGLRRLNADLKVPTPRQFGIDEKRYRDLIPTMAKQALASGSPGNNPRVPTAEEIGALYAEVYG
ncbi:MAG: iron-containing alcohol dehydrogenase [Alphaproteobacteria bacterium]|nr:iron-containing alcohol dehydrogenase [Alphaproteobacteria bacterium]